MNPKIKAQIEAALAAGNVTVHSRPVRQARQAHGKLRCRCAACGVEIVGDAAQTRHLNETGHGRYESDMGVQ